MDDLLQLLPRLEELDGFVGAGLVEVGGACVQSLGPEREKIKVSAPHCAAFWVAKQKVLVALQSKDEVEDILVLAGSYYQIFRPWRKGNALFLYVLFDRLRANPALIRRSLASLV